MKRLSSSRHMIGFLAITIVLITSGCLTSPNPFFGDDDVVQDPSFEGSFVAADSGLRLSIKREALLPPRYSAELVEEGKTSKYVATLFRRQETLFVDVFPANGKVTNDHYAEGAPMPGGMLSAISHLVKRRSSTRLHVLFRLALSQKGIDLFGAMKVSDPSNPLTADPAVRHSTNHDAIVLEAATPEIRSLVQRFAGTNWVHLFQETPLVLLRQ